MLAGYELTPTAPLGEKKRQRDQESRRSHRPALVTSARTAPGALSRKGIVRSSVCRTAIAQATRGSPRSARGARSDSPKRSRPDRGLRRAGDGRDFTGVRRRRHAAALSPTQHPGTGCHSGRLEIQSRRTERPEPVRPDGSVFVRPAVTPLPRARLELLTCSSAAGEWCNSIGCDRLATATKTVVFASVVLAGRVEAANCAGNRPRIAEPCSPRIGRNVVEPIRMPVRSAKQLLGHDRLGLVRPPPERAGERIARGRSARLAVWRRFRILLEQCSKVRCLRTS